MTHHATRREILSTSTVATGKAIPAIKRCANAEVIAIASRDLEKAQPVARSFDIPNVHGSYDSLLQDGQVEAVYLPLPNRLHGEWTGRAAGAGKHVLCEKPAALSPAVAKNMTAACLTNNVLFMEGFMYRFHPQFDCVKRCLAEQRIGKVRLVRVSFSFTFELRHSRIRLKDSLGGGALADVGVYGIAVIRWLTGAEPCRTFALGGRTFEADAGTNFTAILQHTSGMRAMMDGGFDRPRYNRCEIVGESDTITIASPFISTEDADVFRKVRCARFMHLGDQPAKGLPFLIRGVGSIRLPTLTSQKTRHQDGTPSRIVRGRHPSARAQRAGRFSQRACIGRARRRLDRRSGVGSCRRASAKPIHTRAPPSIGGRPARWNGDD